MKNKISYIITFIFLSIGFAYTQAEPLYPSAQLESQPMQNAQVMPTTGTYTGTVYEPFSSAVPSEQAAPNSNNNSSHHLGSVRTFGKPGEVDQSTDSPVGEPWVLAIFALAFAGVLAIRKRKNHRTT